MIAGTLESMVKSPDMAKLPNYRHPITIKEASELTGYSIEYLRRLCRTGKVESEKFGNALVVNRDSLMTYLEDAKADEDRRLGPKLKD